MNKIIIQAHNKKELNELVKKNVSLSEDETYEIKEIKKPFNFLFIKLKGKYEIIITKKSEKKKKKKLKKKKKKVETISDDAVVAIQKAFNEFVQISGFKLKISKIRKNNGSKPNIEISLKGEDTKKLLQNKAEVLLAFEKLFSNLKEVKGKVKVYFDADDYRQKRIESLKALANKKAKIVLETKQSVKLNPMNPRERKIVHETLSKYKNIKTQSVGVDPKRYMIIKYIEKEENI